MILAGTIFIAMWILRQRIGHAGDTRWSEYTCDVKDTGIQLQEIREMLLGKINGILTIIWMMNKHCKKYP